MKNSILLSIALGAAVHAAGQIPTSLHHYPTHAFSIFDLYPSPMGGYLATVQVWDSIDVDPGPAAVWLETISGLEEGAIVAYDANGGYMWHKQITSTVKVTIGNLSFTEDGQFYASGTASGAADVDPGPGVAPVNCICNGGLNAWYGKFSATGDLLWYAQIGDGTSTTQATVRLLYSPLSHDLFLFGEVLSAGNSVDFDGGPGLAILTPEPILGMALGYKNTRIVARLDSSGIFQWHKQWGTSELRQVTRWDDGVNEYLYLAGTSFGWNDPDQLNDHDPGAGVVEPYHPIGTLQDAFASKLDANGDLVWCQFFFGGNGAGFGQNEGANDVSVDSQGNAYLAGRFVSNYPTTVGGSPLSLVPYGGAGTDAFLLKLASADGALIWEKQFGSTSDDTYGATCAIDELDRVYVGSTFQNTAELNSSGTSVQVTANGPQWTNDGFVASFNASGQYLWSGTYGGPGTDGPSQLFPSANEFCMVGYFTETADLDLGPGVNNVVAQQGNDPFFACYDISGLALAAHDVAATNLLQAYPNPANEQLTITGLPVGGTATVLNAYGQVVKTLGLSRTLDVRAWSTGLYFLKSGEAPPIRFVVAR